MIFQNIKVILGSIFLLGIFGLLAVLIPLANYKKKFLLLVNQIDELGKIEKEISFVETQFDLLIAGYIFSEIPTKLQRPDIYEIKEITELKDSIDRLTKVAKPLAIGMTILIVLIIFLLNQFE